MSKVSAKARTEMQAQMAQFESAAADVNALLRKIEPFTRLTTESDPRNMPLGDWNPDHIGLFLFAIAQGSPRLLEDVQRVTLKNPAEFLSLVTTLVRAGYAIRQAEEVEATIQGASV